MYTAPDVLIVVLKRFLFDTHTGNSMVYRQKLDTHVSFPIEGLDLTRLGARSIDTRSLVCWLGNICVLEMTSGADFLEFLGWWKCP